VRRRARVFTCNHRHARACRLGGAGVPGVDLSATKGFGDWVAGVVGFRGADEGVWGWVAGLIAKAAKKAAGKEHKRTRSGAARHARPSPAPPPPLSRVLSGEPRLPRGLAARSALRRLRRGECGHLRRGDYGTPPPLVNMRCGVSVAWRVASRLGAAWRGFVRGMGHGHVCVLLFAHARARAYVSARSCVCACVCAPVRLSAHACVRAPVHAPMRARVLLCVLLCVRACSCACT